MAEIGSHVPWEPVGVPQLMRRRGIVPDGSQAGASSQGEHVLESFGSIQWPIGHSHVGGSVLAPVADVTQLYEHSYVGHAPSTAVTSLYIEPIPSVGAVQLVQPPAITAVDISSTVAPTLSPEMPYPAVHS